MSHSMLPRDLTKVTETTSLIDPIETFHVLTIKSLF